MRAPLLLILCLAIGPIAPLLGCVDDASVTDGLDGADLGETDAELASAGAWYHLDAAAGLGAATLTVANGATVRCPNGRTAKTCTVRALVLPPDCGWECQDGLLSLQGEGLLRGHFERDTFVASAGLDTYAHGLGAASIYQLTAPATCASDPCPASLRAQKLNVASAAVTVTKVDFTHAADPNYVLDPTRGDDQASSVTGLLVSGRIVAHVFRADRVWRLETPRPTCDPQLTARAHAYRGDANDVRQFRTVSEAERAPATDGSGTNAWLVRTAETPTAVTFTSGINDLWAERFEVAKAGCAITTTGEH